MKDINEKPLAVGDMIRYHHDYGIVIKYNELDRSVGVFWFRYNDTWWYNEKRIGSFCKVS